MIMRYYNMDLLNERQQNYVMGQDIFDNYAKLFEINNNYIYYIEMLINKCDKKDIVFRRISFEEKGGINSTTWYGKERGFVDNYAPGERSAFIIITERDIYELFSGLEVHSNDEFLYNVLKFKEAFGNDFMILRGYRLENYHYSHLFTSDDFLNSYEYVKVFLDMVTDYRMRVGRQEVTREEIDMVFNDYVFSSIKQRKK